MHLGRAEHERVVGKRLEVVAHVGVGERSATPGARQSVGGRAEAEESARSQP